MKQPRDAHWADLLTALERMVDSLDGGFGELDLRLILHDGGPRDVLELGRRVRYKLGMAKSVLRET